MDKLNRLYKLHNLFRSRRRPVALTTIQQELECSERTARRVIAELRDELYAPIEYNREQNGYSYSQQRYELPGLWFSPTELHALLTSHQLLSALQPGLFEPYISTIRTRLNDLLSHQTAGNPEIARRVRILQIASRPTDPVVYSTVASALIARKQLRLLYHGRGRDETTERTVSPQRLVYYRSNWYLDTWCHLRKGFRHFSLDRLHPIEIIDETAHEFSEAELDRHFASAYDIFAGEPSATASLRFTPSAARWVADEQWHPQQQSSVLPDGSYELKVPYSRPEELVMDILKYGPEVEVLAPVELRERVAVTLSAAAEKYRNA